MVLETFKKIYQRYSPFGTLILFGVSILLLIIDAIIIGSIESKLFGCLLNTTMSFVIGAIFVSLIIGIFAKALIEKIDLLVIGKLHFSSIPILVLMNIGALIGNISIFLILISYAISAAILLLGETLTRKSEISDTLAIALAYYILMFAFIPSFIKCI